MTFVSTVLRSSFLKALFFLRLCLFETGPSDDLSGRAPRGIEEPFVPIDVDSNLIGPMGVPYSNIVGPTDVPLAPQSSTFETTKSIRSEAPQVMGAISTLRDFKTTGVPSTFAQAAKLKRMALAKEKDLAKSRDYTMVDIIYQSQQNYLSKSLQLEGFATLKKIKDSGEIVVLPSLYLSKFIDFVNTLNGQNC
ncbi:hypothetical protein TEA_028258 [Camellia sinensis var. sinensis]|uniref:Uncharacterized protein n=1 Tax=Camellia sinensis var. sinensis TaxID=542762 RepID=A0A4S4EXF5_CAMSN|nr:hypothetical protein TEA_028258 [Camellia sinensis var. sinensis]